MAKKSPSPKTRRIPLLTGRKSLWPPYGTSKPKCPICANSLRDGDGIAYLVTGATVDLAKYSLDVVDDLEGFLYLHFHTANDKHNVGIDLAKDVHFGQAEWCFCSLQCLKKWLVDTVDELIVKQERQVLSEKARVKKKKP